MKYRKTYSQCIVDGCDRKVKARLSRSQWCIQHLIVRMTARLPRRKKARMIRYILWRYNRPDPVRDAYEEVFAALAKHEAEVGGPIMVQIPLSALAPPEDLPVVEDEGFSVP